jgi:hypothetical protein
MGSIVLYWLYAGINKLLPHHSALIDALIDRARQIFRQSWLFNQGITVSTCVVSTVLGYVVYVLLKIMFRFIGSLRFYDAGIIFIIIALAMTSLSISGHSLSPNIRFRGFLKHFYIPTITAASFVLLGAAIDFVIYIVGLVRVLFQMA